MLIVLYGSTAEMGYISKQYFEKQGFSAVEKMSYSPEKERAVSRYTQRNYHTKEEVESCDFVYESNGYLVGFDKKQIIDAVRGRENKFLRFSMANLDFLREIKLTYGEYVHVVSTYIDHSSLDAITRSLSEVTEEEYQTRMAMGQAVKEAFVNNRELFDDVVIYGGKESPFGLDFLCKQYEFIIQRLKKKEHQLNSKLYVDLPYSGNKPFLFVSYSHTDTQKILPLLSALQRRSFRIWYDDGIDGGENWSKLIGEKISDCTNFLCLITEHSVCSTEVRAELYGARKTKKKILPIREGDAEFSFDVEMYINGNYQVLDFKDPDLLDRLERAIDSEIRES